MAQKKFIVLTTNQLINYVKNLEWTRRPKELHIHNTWLPAHKHFDGSNYQKLQYGMWRYHTKNLGWSDIGQHLTLAPDGKWILGRDFMKNPSSIRGRNSKGFAIEMIGNFDKGNDKLEGKQKESILALSKFMINFFNLSYEKGIVFHNQYSGKTCPGSSINRKTFIQEVEDYDKVKPSRITSCKKPSYLYGVIAVDRLNFRAFPFGPKVQPFTRGIKRDEHVEILGKNKKGTWYNIKYRGAVGWVASRYVYLIMEVKKEDFKVTKGNFQAIMGSYLSVSPSTFTIGNGLKLDTSKHPHGMIGHDEVKGWVLSGFGSSASETAKDLVSGIEVYPDIKMKESGYIGKTSEGLSVQRSIVGYDRDIGRIVFIIHPSCNIEKAYDLARKHGLEYAISLASGENLTFKHKGNLYYKGKAPDNVIKYE